MIKKSLVILLVFAVFFSIAPASALSNETFEASESLKEARVCLKDLEDREIPILRANASLQEAIQQYNAQLALENTKNINGNYELTHTYSEDVCEIKESAIKAQDELKIFQEAYFEAASEIDVSSMDAEYNEIISSFEGERFEETIPLIDIGYTRLSEVQASQTTFRLFYDTTTRNLKNFFINNWVKILIGLIIALIVLIVSWKTIKRVRINKQIRRLMIRRNTLDLLIKQLQKNYFSTKKISETEYRVKLEKFKNMIRDIDRQIPLLKEEIVKLRKQNKAHEKKPENIAQAMAQKKKEEKQIVKKSRKKAKLLTKAAKQHHRNKKKLGENHVKLKKVKAKAQKRSQRKAEEKRILSKIKREKELKKAARKERKASKKRSRKRR